MLFSAQLDTDLLGEFKQLVGNLFAAQEQREIARLKPLIEARRKEHKSTAVLEHRLIALVTRKIQREIA